MGDYIGRDKIIQSGNKSNLKIDNHKPSGEGWIKGITIGVILIVIGYILKIALGF